MLVFGSIVALIVGTFVVADTSLLRAEKTLAHVGVVVASAALLGLGVLLRSTALLLRRFLDDS